MPASSFPAPSPGQRFLAVAVPVALLQSAVVGSLFLLPALPLLLVPSAASRSALLRWASAVEAAWLGFASALLRLGIGPRVVIHTRGAAGPRELLAPGQDVLIASNHRTRLDWMFLWGLAAALGRLGGLNVVLKDSLRSAPGFGWATQCFAFAFMCRRDREADLQTLRDTCRLLGGRGSLALLLFPEGTDLSESNLERSRAFAESAGLPAYEQVLHPRTAGFGAAWEALRSAAEARGAPPPALLDVTMGYEDYAPGERPSEASVFLRGRCPRELHVLVAREEVPAGEAGRGSDGSQGPEDLCRRLFDAKEQKLVRFYRPCSDGAPPDTAVLAADARQELMEAPGARRALLGGVAAVAAAEGLAAALAWRLGAARSAVGLGCCCLAFAGLTRATGGIDRVLLWHMRRWPGGAGRKAD